jgi:hexulose-6-phosphate isomerase
MTDSEDRQLKARPTGKLSRREAMAYASAFGSAFMAAQGLAAEGPYGAAETKGKPEAPNSPGKRYDMKKSINLWALPYPDKMTLEECFEICKDAGFDGVEVNYALEGDLSPEASEADIRAVGEMARKMGLQISGLCSFLYWPYSLTHNDPERRMEGLELARKMIRASWLLGTDNLLVIAGSVYVPWIEDDPPVPHDVCDRRAREAIGRLLPEAEKARVCLNVENIFVNGYLHSPQEMIEFVDSFKSDRVQVHFDTGNIMLYHFPEHWIRLLGKRIKNVHLKEYTKKVHEFNLHTFRPLLDGTTNWPAVIEAFDEVGYRGYLTFEYFNPYPHWPEMLVYQTSEILDRMLGRKT